MCSEHQASVTLLNGTTLQSIENTKAAGESPEVGSQSAHLVHHLVIHLTAPFAFLFLQSNPKAVQPHFKFNK
jgi:hypothetical protein